MEGCEINSVQSFVKVLYFIAYDGKLANYICANYIFTCYFAHLYVHTEV